MKHNLHGAQSLDLFILHVYHLGIFFYGSNFPLLPHSAPVDSPFQALVLGQEVRCVNVSSWKWLCFFNLVIVWDRIACTPGWPHIHYADKTAKLLVLLPLPSKCQHYRPAQIQTCHHFVPLWLMSLLLPANL